MTVPKLLIQVLKAQELLVYCRYSRVVLLLCQVGILNFKKLSLTFEFICSLKVLRIFVFVLMNSVPRGNTICFGINHVLLKLYLH